MSPGLALQILEQTHETNRELYRIVMASVADVRKVRPMFFERTPRAQRHADMVAALGRPRLELTASSLLREWLVKSQNSMLCDFLDALGIPHKDGAVEELPATMDDAKLRSAVDVLVGKYPPENVAVYLNAFYFMNDVRWANLENILQSDSKLQLGS